MTIPATQIAADLAHIIGQGSVTVSIEGDTADGLKTVRSRHDILADEGLRDQYRFSVYVRDADVDVEPAAGQEVTIAGVVYRILAVDTDPLESYWEMHLGEEFAV